MTTREILKVCKTCQEPKPEAAFSITDKKRGYTYPHCKACCAAKKKAERQADPVKYNTYQRSYYEANKEALLPRYRAANLRAYYRLKDEVFSLLGGHCARCGHRNWGVLQIDHIEGGGGRERAESGYSQTLRKMRDELRSGGGQDQYQLLCANCHHTKTTASHRGRPRIVLP